MRTGPDELESAIDRLYQQPADAFTGARNALAAEWKAKGDKDASARIKALGKPTAVAWAVNSSGASSQGAGELTGGLSARAARTGRAAA